MTKTGWWGLSECSQEHILQKISEGYTSGEVVEEDDDEEEEEQ